MDAKRPNPQDLVQEPRSHILCGKGITESERAPLTEGSLLCSAAAAKSLQSCPTLCDPPHSRVQLWQPTRFLCPWDSSGKNTGVGCHFLLPRPFRYDLNQILYDYTVQVRNRFKELDLID